MIVIEVFMDGRCDRGTESEWKEATLADASSADYVLQTVARRQRLRWQPRTLMAPKCAGPWKL